MNGKTYESFDEIFENYITPCNLHMEAAANNKKFYNIKMDQLEKKLREDKEKDEEILAIAETNKYLLSQSYIPAVDDILLYECLDEEMLQNIIKKL